MLFCTCNMQALTLHDLTVIAMLTRQADRLWARDLSRDKSPVMELFGGQLQGNIVCHKCKSRFTKCAAAPDAASGVMPLVWRPT